MAKEQQRPQKSPNRKQLATRKRDEKAQRIITWIAIGVGVVILSVLGYGVVSELFIKANAPVARVDGEPIKTKDYQARVRFERLSTRSQILQYENYLAQYDTTDEFMQTLATQLQQQKQQLELQLAPGSVAIFGSSVLDKMVEERLVSKEAARLGITVTPEEVDRQIESLFGYDRDAVAATDPLTTTGTVTNTKTPMTRAEFETYYEQFKSVYLRPSGLSEEAFRQSVEIELLRPKVVEALTQDIETKANQAQVTVLVTGTLEAALALQERLNAGEAVDALVEELNNSETGGGWAADLGWVQPGRLTTDFSADVDTAAFEIPVGTASDPITRNETEYYVVFVRAREVRDLDEATLSAAREQRFSEWLAEQKQSRVEYLDYTKVTPDTP
ncbi:MAG: SurA N-terminal domain-containing protein [Anaerolineae bacterium]|mgnify:CR=1 FL=1|nr:SurA N-terminal domain-containing protein [Anaerolineae bacterium]HXK42992.1 SurA N-terminal domain-containing protein [Anaerolineae bacterium]